MRRTLTIFACLFYAGVFAQGEKGLFLAAREYQPRKAQEKVTIAVSWAELQKHQIIPQAGDFDITDNNFGKKVTKEILSENGEPHTVLFDFVFGSEEAVYSFSVRPNGKSIQTRQSFPPEIATHISISYLKHEEVKSWPDKIIESTMSMYPEPATLPNYSPGSFNHEVAFFLTAMLKQNNPAYFTYVKKWADRFIDSHGAINPKFYNVNNYRLDDMLPGRVFISLYEATKDVKYKNAAAQLRQQLQYQPRTSDGGYWHNQTLPYQMWIEGLYMSGVFSMQYAKAFNEPSLLNDPMQQIRLMQEHNADPGTGLLYHGWDESGNKVWANEESGTSPEFWSRGLGWHLMALLECIDYIPLENMERKEVGMLFRNLAKAVMKYQDPKTGLWFQVINKGYEPRNWHETSASAMFAYAFAKGHNNGILDKTYLAAAQKAFETLKKDYIFFDDNGRLYMDGIVKVGSLNTQISKGDLDYYVSTERRVNDYKGLGALLYLTQELDRKH